MCTMNHTADLSGGTTVSDCHSGQSQTPRKKAFPVYRASRRRSRPEPAELEVPPGPLKQFVTASFSVLTLPFKSAAEENKDRLKHTIQEYEEEHVVRSRRWLPRIGFLDYHCKFCPDTLMPAKPECQQLWHRLFLCRTYVCPHCFDHYNRLDTRVFFFLKPRNFKSTLHPPRRRRRKSRRRSAA